MGFADAAPAVCYHWPMRASAIVVLVTFLLGCGQGGPPSTQTMSAKFATLGEKTSFLHQYVTFRRTYQTLDFAISFQNNSGGGVPGPSEWDVRLVATVPPTELPAWIPLGATTAATATAAPSPPDLGWLKAVPTNLDLSGVHEWYAVAGRTVGIDRARSIVVYRAFAQ